MLKKIFKNVEKIKKMLKKIKKNVEKIKNLFQWTELRR